MSLGHVAGPVAQDALDALVAQFSDRSAFIRELVQNSLDAGAGRVDLLLETDEAGCLVVDVYDDGEGMDRQIIETCLLTLFRSSKERDLTKIGKFGVGFVSLFALDPTEVVVDTARDGTTHQVRFQRDRSYRLYALDRPFEGTRVRIHTREKGDTARELAIAIDRALAYWCRFATADIWSEATHAVWGWDPRQVRADFDIEAPLTVRVEEDGFRAVLGPTGLDRSPVAYHNRGLTLLEADEAVIPGVGFRVEAGKLEHTLTRDNVLRDAHYRDVIDRLKRIAREELRPAWLTALRQACEDADDVRRAELLAVSHPLACPLPRELACLKTTDGRLVSLAELAPRLGFLGRITGSSAIHHAPAGSPLASASRKPVLVGPSSEDDEATPEMHAVVRFLELEPEPLSARWRVAEPVDRDPLLAATDALARTSGTEITGVRGVLLHPPPAERTLAFRQRAPGELRGASDGWGDQDGALLVHLDDPLLRTLALLPVDVAAPLLLRAALCAADPAPVALQANLVTHLQGALAAHSTGEGL